MMPEDNPVAATAWTIRPFRPNDSPTIAGILRDSMEAAQWPAESYTTLAAESSGLLLVCASNAQIVGFLAARQAADEAEILNIAVRSGFRRQGAASALLFATVEALRRSGVARVFLELRASNVAARALYDRHGFLPSGIRKSYYRDPVEDAICMQKNLLASSGQSSTKLPDVPS